MNYGETKYITATLYDIKDNRIKDAEMNLYLGEGCVVLKTDNKGQISMAFGMTAGTFKFNISYIGDEKYDASSKIITVTVKELTTVITTTNAPQSTSNLPISNSNTDISSNSVITKPSSKVTILKITGISNGGTYSYNGKCALKLSANIDLTVNLKVGNKNYKFKFNRGKYTLKFSNYNLKKGNKYKFTFSGGNAIYEVKKLSVTIKTK